MSDTPRMQSALLDVPDAGFAKIWQVGCEIERELTTAQERIKRLEEAGDEAIYKTNLFDRELHWNKAKEAKL